MIIVNNYLNLCVSITDGKNTTSYYSNASGSTQTRQGLDSYAYVPYIIPTFNSSSNAKRDGQLTGKVKLNITGTYYNGEIGSGSSKVNQGGNYKPTIKYKFWKVGESQPSTYAYTIPGPSITTSNGTFTISNYQIGSADDQATNYFNPSFSYRVRIYIQDTFKSSESPELSIPVGEAVWTEYKDRVDFKKLTIQNVEVTPGGGGAGDYENLINKPEINGVTLIGDKTASQLGFASVATSGSYNDLSNKPTIPTVNNGTLTIQKNGTNVQTFTANQSSNVTANITVPTKTSDLTNDSNYISSSQSTVGSTDRPVYLNNGTPTQTNTPASGNYFRGVPFVTSGGVMEIGRYIDFHPTNNSTLDFNKRLDAGSGTTARTLTLPDKTGTIAITSDMPTKTGDLTNNGDGTSGYKYINDIGKDGLYYGDSELKGIGVYEDDHIYFEVINGNVTYTKAIANNSDLPTKVSDLTNDSNFVTNTDYANISVGGVVKVWDSAYGLKMDTSGFIEGNSVNYSDYNNKVPNFVVSKGTLENVITGKGLIDSSYHDSTKQDELVSGTNIKTINGTSILGSGNISVGGGTTATDVQVNGTSITSGGVANLVTQTAYNSSTNKIATKNDIPTNVSQLTNDSGYTTNTGTITGIKMNGASKGTSGVVDLGTVITSHQTIKTINNTSMTGSGNVAVQPTLVSGTNIKTINSTSLLGSGNIAVQSTLSTTTGTLSITKTSGNSTCTGTYARYGNVVSLDLELKTTGTINSGADVFVGKITSFTPKKTGELIGYYGARPIIAGYGTDQVITVRNASASNISSGNTLNIRGTIIV